MSMVDAGAMPGFRTPPHNVEAEQALLGAILISNDAYPCVARFLRPEHFYEPVHGRIYAAMAAVIERGGIADPVKLARQFSQDEALRELDGAQYLARIARAAETILNAEDYGRYIHDLAVKRGLIATAEQLVNRAYDPSETTPSADLVAEADSSIKRLSLEGAVTSPVRACALPSVDLDAIAERTPPPERWLIGDWLPVGTAGLLAGPGAVGKSFLEIIRMVCLALGLPFMGYETDACPVIGYFSEDNDQRLGRRLKMICDALDVDPRRLKGRFELVSTVGERRLIVVGDRNSFTVQPTSWLSEVHERARALAARYVSFDHAGRLTSMNRNDPNQVFDLFSHLDALASSIDGCVCMLTHPSKTDLRAGKGPQVSGAIAMIDAPRWVHSLKPVKTEDAEQFRVLTNEKPNYSKRFAIKLEENSRGVVENAGEVDPDNPAGAKSVSSRGRPSQADKTFEALRELYLSRGTPVGLDDLVSECVRRGVIAEAEGNSEAWRARRRTVRGHLFKLQRLVDERDEAFAVKPEGLAA